MWQFIPSTGYKFGLTRDTYIDERMDPVKATAAAIAYLKELHHMFGDWMTVLAAYNCGEGRVLRTINSQNVNYLDNFWDLYEKLPRETARYVPRFLATLHIMKNKALYGLDSVKLDPPITYTVAPVARRSHLKNYASVIGVSEETLKLLNPELRKAITPSTTYNLKVPSDKKQLFGQHQLGVHHSTETQKQIRLPQSPQRAEYQFHCPALWGQHPYHCPGQPTQPALHDYFGADLQNPSFPQWVCHTRRSSKKIQQTGHSSGP